MVYFDFDDFDPPGEIGVEGRWLIQTPEGGIIEGTRGALQGDVAHLLHVVGHRVGAWRINPPTSRTLDFDDGSTLTVFDDFEQLESFCNCPLLVFV